MARKIDISEKLSFEENPVIAIDGVELEVNSDAETMLRIMAAYEEQDGIRTAVNVLSLLFSEEDREKLYAIRRDGRKLSISDLATIAMEAASLAMGDSGEKE